MEKRVTLSLTEYNQLKEIRDIKGNEYPKALKNHIAELKNIIDRKDHKIFQLKGKISSNDDKISVLSKKLKYIKSRLICKIMIKLGLWMTDWIDFENMMEANWRAFSFPDTAFSLLHKTPKIEDTLNGKR